jgi:alkylhydroperoxidase family enzyme
MLPREGLTGPEENLWPNGRSANVLRALSLVPNELKNWLALSSAQYLSVPGMANLVGQDDRSINRMQMELVAGRVSSVNECFY